MATNNDTQVKQEDSKAIHDLFYVYHYADDLGVIKSKLAEYVATVRREAFKEMIGAITVLPLQGTMNYRRGYEEGVRDAIRTLESIC